MTTKILLSQVSAPNTATTGSVVSLQSDGTFGSGTTIANGTSNVSITSANGNINLSVAGNTKVSIDSSTLALASLQGIKFQATQSASSDANTLDDYEEGTFTPIVSGNGSSPNQACYGMYTKVGRAVVCTVRIIIGSSSTLTHFGGFTGLPFTSSSFQNLAGGGGGREYGQTGAFWQASVTASDTSVSVGKPDNNNTADYRYAFNFHFTYQTA